MGAGRGGRGVELAGEVCEKKGKEREVIGTELWKRNR